MQHPDFTKYTGKCGRLLARSPELGARVQWTTSRGEWLGVVWCVDHHRHIAGVRVESLDRGDGGAHGLPETDNVAWTALRPCNGEALR